MIYYLTWFEKDGDEYMGEALLPGVSEEDVRRVFELKPEDPPGDCLEVERASPCMARREGQRRQCSTRPVRLLRGDVSVLSRSMCWVPRSFRSKRPSVLHITDNLLGLLVG